MVSLFRRKPSPTPEALPAPQAPSVICISDRAFDVVGHLRMVEGLPRVDWDAAFDWVLAFEQEQDTVAAAIALLRAWLLHLRDALGPGYRLDDGEAMILSSFEPAEARAAEEFMLRTLSRVARVLDGVAKPDEASRVLVVMDDDDTYYRYIARFDRDGGEYAFSSGMYVGSGLPHFVTTKGEMRSIEPVVAHELTHACLAHLPIPLWLNEGLAVNTEHRLCGGANRFTPLEMHRKHAAFWDDGRIQEFWSGTSFRRADDGNMLSYDLGRILVEQLSRGDWPRFAAFVNSAHHDDAGALAAARELDVDLGASVAAWVGRSGANWSPDPGRWQQMETRTE